MGRRGRCRLRTGNEGKVELTWSNKHLRLVTLDEPDGDALLYRWVRPSDFRVAEVRLLNEVGRVGEGDNLLIRGDALHALEALNSDAAGGPRLTGQVKLAYLDPPFNTGKTFLQYEDNLEKSIWLTMMRDRLQQVKRLLRGDGSVWVHCDDSMYGYLRVVMDQVFGADKFIATFIWRKVDSPSENKKALAIDHDYILCYSKTAGGTRFRPKPDASVALAFGKVDERTERRYRDRLLKKNGKSSRRRERWTMWFPIPGPDGVDVFPIDDDGREARWSASAETVAEWFEADRHIDDPTDQHIIWVERPGHFVRTRPEPASKDEDDAKPRWRLEPDGTHWVPYTREWAPETPVRPWPTIWVSSPDAAAQTLASEALESDEFEGLDPDGPIARALQAIAAIDVLDDVKTTRQAKAHLRKLFPGTSVFDTPKPEEFMARIIEIASDADDLVLDCFAGSGSTLATAHKLGRAWVGVEIERETVETFTAPRLAKVVAGDDDGGISKVVGWEGGGGFRVMDVAPSMFTEVDDLVVLADWATGGALAEATTAQLGYTPEVRGPFCGRKGRSRLAVIDGLVNCAVADLVLGQLLDDEMVLICGTALEPGVGQHVAAVRPGSRAQPIPQAILAGYGRPRRWSLPEPVAEAAS